MLKPSTNQAKRYLFYNHCRSTHPKIWSSMPSRPHPSRTLRLSSSVKIPTTSLNKLMDCVSASWNQSCHHLRSRIFTRIWKMTPFSSSKHQNMATSPNGHNKVCSCSMHPSLYKTASQTHTRNVDGNNLLLRSLTSSTKSVMVLCFCCGANQPKTKPKVSTQTSIISWKHPIPRLCQSIKDSWLQVIYLLNQTTFPNAMT